MNDGIGLIYVGGGFFAGVPARDLTLEEVEIYGRAKLIRSGLYVEPDEPKGKPRPAENKGGQPPQESK